MITVYAEVLEKMLAGGYRFAVRNGRLFRWQRRLYAGQFVILYEYLLTSWVEVVICALIPGANVQKFPGDRYQVKPPGRPPLILYGEHLNQTWFRDICSDEQLVESWEDIRKWADYEEEQARENERR